MSGDPTDAPTTELVDADIGDDELAEADELPVVARMVVEIRSGGTRTIARGAVEDLLNDQQVAVEASAGSPLELSRALAKMLFPTSRGLGSRVARKLLTRVLGDDQD